MKENPNVVDGPLLLGEIYKNKKELIKSKKYYLRAAQIDGKNVDAILGLAFIAFSRDQYDMALDQYQKAVEYDSNRAEIYRLLGDTYRKIGQGQIAIKNYKQFLELSPTSSYKRKIETYIRTME
jgi:tetratricopeptide (TPR) repeat protein